MTKKWTEMSYRTYQFSGDDANYFLQGQLTQDISIISESKCHYSAYCNHKGSMFANLLVYNDNKGFYIRIHKDQSDFVIKRLKMFILRASVKVENIDVRTFSLNKSFAKDICDKFNVDVPNLFSISEFKNSKLFALPNDYFEISTSETSVIDYITNELNNYFEEIEKTRILSGNFHITKETDQRVMPQETTLEKWGGISYTKGCYVGQEIIARSKYRGKIRKGLAVTTIEGHVNININDEIIADGKKVGFVLEVQKTNDNTVCSAILMLSVDGSICNLANEKVRFRFL